MLRDVHTLVHSTPESLSPVAFAATPVLNAERVVTETELWHARFAHTGYEGMAQIASGAVRGIYTCKCCSITRATREAVRYLCASTTQSSTEWT
jgi:hypothetical protein